jgi:hypothetical protein
MKTVGITVLGDFILSEGVEPILENLPGILLNAGGPPIRGATA